MSDKILVTGAAGFIGFHVAQRLLQAGRSVVGLDNINDYYDPTLKDARLSLLRNDPNFDFIKLDLADRAEMKALFAKHRFPVAIHLAAQAGVRYSIDHPHAYVDANLEGFTNVLEGCRQTIAGICCLLRHHLFTARTPNCLFWCTTASIIPSAFMRRRKRPMS